MVRMVMVLLCGLVLVSGTPLDDSHERAYYSDTLVSAMSFADPTSDEFFAVDETARVQAAVASAVFHSSGGEVATVRAFFKDHALRCSDVNASHGDRFFLWPSFQRKQEGRTAIGKTKVPTVFLFFGTTLSLGGLPRAHQPIPPCIQRARHAVCNL